MRMCVIWLLVLAALLTAGDWSLEPRAGVTWYATEGSVAVIDTVVGSRGDFKFSTGATALFAGRIGLYFDTDVFATVGNAAFRPRFAEFRCGVESRITERIRLRVEHSCGHPIDSYNGERSLRYFTGYNSISLSWGY